MTPFTTDPTATVTIGVNSGTAAAVASATPSGILPLNVGPNTITITVTAQDCVTTHSYILTVTRAQSSNSYLTRFSISSGTLTPVPGTSNYTAQVTYDITALTVTPVTTDQTATVTIGVNSGTAAAVASGTPSGNLPLNVGPNIITIIVTAQDGVTTHSYVLTATREKSTNSLLSRISISSGTLPPVIGPPNFTANVTNATSSVRLTPFTSDPGQTVTIDGMAVASGTPSAGIPLSLGANTITIISTAPDGVTTQQYIITIIRALPSDIHLTHLAISSGTLAPVTGTPNYTVNVTNAITAVAVTAITEDPLSTMTISVNGGTAAAITSGTPSGELPLNVGSNNITIIVTAQDGVTTQPYVITVTRATGALFSLYQPIQPISVTKPTDTVSIENDGIMVHQGVSPNGDGINDFLTIDGITQYPDNQLTIIDRNGALLYQAKGYDNGSKAFDGHSSVNGKLLQSGTYFYSLDYGVNGQSKHKTGYILLKY